MMEKRILLIFVLILVLGGISMHKGLPAKSISGNYQATAYPPSKLEEMIRKNPDKYALIDVRTKGEYEDAHLPGAIHADFYDTDALKKAVGDKIPITYCAFSAMRGPYAAYQLYQAGFKNVGVLDGGISAWAEDTLAIDSADPNVKSVFTHPKNIFPDRPKGEYPKDAGEVEFNITAARFEFNPNKIVVKHGQKVTLNLKSLDVAHGFSLPEFGIEEELLPREPVTVTFIADRKGNFPFVCSVICGAGHDHASMVGNLIVE
jgi:cytochrome c oxidase subunit 2